MFRMFRMFRYATGGGTHRRIFCSFFPIFPFLLSFVSQARCLELVASAQDWRNEQRAAIQAHVEHMESALRGSRPSIAAAVSGGITSASLALTELDNVPEAFADVNEGELLRAMPTEYQE